MPDTEGVNNDNNVNNCAWIANGISHAKAKDMVISETHTSTHNYTHSQAHTPTHTHTHTCSAARLYNLCICWGHRGRRTHVAASAPIAVLCFILNAFNCCVNTHTHILRQLQAVVCGSSLTSGSACQTAARLTAAFKTCLPAKLMSFAITQQATPRCPPAWSECMSVCVCVCTLFAVVSLTAGATARERELGRLQKLLATTKHK